MYVRWFRRVGNLLGFITILEIVISLDASLVGASSFLCLITKNNLLIEEEDTKWLITFSKA
jgi:hypothetical protein